MQRRNRLTNILSHLKRLTLFLRNRTNSAAKAGLTTVKGRLTRRHSILMVSLNSLNNLRQIQLLLRQLSQQLQPLA